jgi:hypothetical protein
MKRSPINLAMVIVAVLLIATPAFALAERNDAVTTHGLDINDLIVVSTSILSFVLGAISFVAYRRDGRAKFLFVTLAFFIFASKGILIIGNDLLSLQQPYLDIVAHSLDFVVLLCFFIGMVKK